MTEEAALPPFFGCTKEKRYADEALQTAFEIKTTCDEISRKLLRWHWENKPGEHSLGALLDHIRTRQQESPEYYDRLPDLAGRNSWQQLDTALCMRVLLDPEKDAARPLDLLGNTEHPAAARRACNAVRTARNEAGPCLRPHGGWRRRRSSSTRPWKHWKKAMQARPCAPVSWAVLPAG